MKYLINLLFKYYSIRTVWGRYIDGPYVLWVDEQTSIAVTCHLQFINHSDKPNACYYDSLKAVAIKDIEKDEKITHDYSIGM